MVLSRTSTVSGHEPVNKERNTIHEVAVSLNLNIVSEKIKKSESVQTVFDG